MDQPNPEQLPIADPKSDTGRLNRSSRLPTFFLPIACLGAMLAGVAAWAAGEACLDLYKPSAKAAAEPYAFKQLNIEKDHADSLNAAIAFGFLAGATGMVLGGLGGWASGSLKRGVIGSLVGMALGVAGAALVSMLVVPLHRRFYEPEFPDLKVPILIHGAIWSVIGVAAGLGFGIAFGARGRLAQAATGGLLGALVATVFYDVAGAVLIPFSETDLPISPSMLARFLARASVVLGTVVGTLWAIREPKPKSS